MGLMDAAHVAKGETLLRGSSSWTQTRILSRKNLLLARRNWKGTAGQLVMRAWVPCVAPRGACAEMTAAAPVDAQRLRCVS